MSQRKHPAARAAHGAKRTVEPIAFVPEDEIPACPTGMLKATRDIWYSYWRSDAAGRLDRELALYRARRWIRQVDELERAWKVFRSERYMPGSMGQTKLSDAWKHIQSLEAMVAKSEEELLMTRASREAAGLPRTSTPADLNRRMSEPDEPMGPRALEEWKAI